MENIEDVIKKQLDKTLKETNFSTLGQLYKGKVRDNYTKGDVRVIVSTDRISAFDRVITTIPFKGQLLNQISTFWFEKTKKLVNNHLIEVPDPNVSVVRQCETILIEMVLREYITGTAWRYYTKGESISGINLPKGLVKNQKLDDVLITPSTKEETGHDIYLSKEEILNKKMVDKKIYEEMEEMSLKLFKFAQNLCKKNSLILVDTKYEFGLNKGDLMVIDEIHTQDSSRFWIFDSYKERFKNGQDPDILDKEVFRVWLMKTYPDKFPNIGPNDEIPPITESIKVETARLYIKSYEKITGLKFNPEIANVLERIKKNLKKSNYL